MFDRIRVAFSAIMRKIGLWTKETMSWRQFKLDITNLPNQHGHFGLIKTKLVPFACEHSFDFWVTNYHNDTSNFILFRTKITESQSEFILGFLDELKRSRLIVNWEQSSWDPESDALNRIEGLRRLGFDPNENFIVGFDSINRRIEVSPDNNLEERQKQLTALFETVGDCTKSVYNHLGSKPKDLWAVSLFVHLLLNSLDYSGPDTPSEEDKIRQIPPW